MNIWKNYQVPTVYYLELNYNNNDIFRKYSRLSYGVTRLLRKLHGVSKYDLISAQLHIFTKKYSSYTIFNYSEISGRKVRGQKKQKQNVQNLKYM